MSQQLEKQAFETWWASEREASFRRAQPDEAEPVREGWGAACKEKAWLAWQAARSGPSVQLGEVLFSFNSFQDWVNKAQRIWRFHEVDSRHTVCIDQRGRICGWGAHFRRARDEGAFPINVHRLRPTEETGL